jgi:hypothetical protein
MYGILADFFYFGQSTQSFREMRKEEGRGVEGGLYTGRSSERT